ncbi:AMP-binding protein [Alkalilimnicola ehrlichii]|uniref:Non-ribosomal peptide synthetase n=1 Tax=Alkalilimnicola ehrlichii TaxID=351052 RepID=A0A3E0X1C0_9GAMM|nr:AMP-binding protein [Alkalilimnicola ehrlichii]RFA38526.1 hypothetical protein CAL65_04030 [Alkalilimnicola ehrlichii]
MSVSTTTNLAQRLLRELQDMGVSLSVEQGRNIRLRAPIGALDEGLVSAVRQQKADLIALLGQAGSPALAVNPEERLEPFPLTDIQRAYWLGRQKAFDLGETAIHFYSEVDTQGLDIERLERAWNKVIQRHDMLRAVVNTAGEQQVLAVVDPYPIEVHDLRCLAADERREILAAKREQLSHSARTTDDWPGFLIEVARLDDCTSRLYISVDLLHVDGASLLIVFEDWARFYDDETLSAAPLELTYRDYVLDEARQQNSARYQEDLAYWHEEVRRLPPAPALPTLPEADGGRFARRSFELSEADYQRLRSRAASLGVTPTILIMIAFAEVIRHWSKDLSFTLNVTLFNRLPVHPDVNKLVGDFTSMILLGIDHKEGETLAEKAVRLQAKLWGHLDHRTVSGVTVLGELNNYLKSGSATVMPVVFTSLLDLKGQGFSLDWLDKFGEVAYTLTQTPQVYLDHQVRETARGSLEASWDYIPAMFPDGMIEAMFSAYEKLLGQLIGSEALWQSTALCYTPEEQLAQFAMVNQTERVFANGSETLYSLFLKQAAQREAEPALIHSERSISYGELKHATAVLGEQLRGFNAGPNDIVAILLPKTWEQVVAVLGVHASGAAYLPIDPEQPPARVRYFLENSEAVALIAQPELLSDLELPEGLPTLTLDDEWFDTAQTKAATSYPSALPENLSHVIYTSGSTGAPKGVMVEHRNVVNRLLDINERYRIGPNDKILALTALHHDLSVYDIFGMLAAGGQIVIPDAPQRKDPAHWLDLLGKHQITLWNSVPAFLDMLLDFQDEHAGAKAAATLPSSLRWVILAGDWIPVTLPERLRRYRPDIQLVASGGPTETTIWDIFYHVDVVDPSWKSIPYGKPLTNSRYYILNKLLKPVPVWVPGEMYIAGAGVTRGYLNDPEKRPINTLCIRTRGSGSIVAAIWAVGCRTAPSSSSDETIFKSKYAGSVSSYRKSSIRRERIRKSNTPLPMSSSGVGNRAWCCSLFRTARVQTYRTRSSPPRKTILPKAEWR